MKTVSFFGKTVSKLIIGDNPINGHSYIVDQIDGNTMKAFYTAEKIKETAGTDHFEQAFIRIVKGEER